MRRTRPAIVAAAVAAAIGSSAPMRAVTRVDARSSTSYSI